MQSSPKASKSPKPERSQQGEPAVGSGGGATSPGGNPKRRAPFEIQVEQRGEMALVHLTGEFDLASEKEFKDKMRVVANDGLGKLVLDLRELTFIDSTGLRMILEQWNRFRADGLDLSILPGSGQVQRVFAMTGLAELLPFADGASPR